MWRRRIAWWGLFGVLGCSSGPATQTDAGVDSGTPMPSTLTASGDGGVTGMISAPKPTVGYDATGNSGTFFLKRTMGTMLAFKADITIGFTGAPAAGTTYTTATQGFTCNATITSGSAAANTWVALYGQPPQADRGTCSLRFDSAAVGASGYDVTGTLSVSGTASGGASSGVVDLAGTF